MNNKNLSRKELDVLERQRRLASTYKKSNATDQQLKRPTKKPPPPVKGRQQQKAKPLLSTSAVLAAARSRAAAAKTGLTPAATNLTSSKASVSQSSSEQGPKNNTIDLTEKNSAEKQHKRPSRKSRPAPPPTSNPESGVETAKVKSLPTLARKANTNRPSNTLANLVQNVKSISKNDVDPLSAMGGIDDQSSETLPTLEPDHFWKNLREWNFLLDLSENNENQQQQKQQAQQGKKQQESHEKEEGEEDETEKTPTEVTSKKSLPNIFLNSKHYVAAWAPLVLAETRAQVISEVLSNYTGNIQHAQVHSSVTSNNKRGNKSKNDYHFWEDSDTDATFIKIQPSKYNNSNLFFMAHDLALLVPLIYKEAVVALLRQHNSSKNNFSQPPAPAFDWNKCGLVAHATYSRKDLHGLTLQVSKRKWAMLGQDEMIIFKLGGNITSLREFTALCRVEHIPMKRFLLGQHLDQEESSSSSKKSSSCPQDLLKTMGGSQALGKGFAAYVQKKFNPSQLNAIAASAHEYGEGGFTLIKGPPGTGKTTTLVAVLNSLHIRQYNKYYEEVRRIAALPMAGKNCQFALDLARKSKPRLLVCAPSNAAVDNVILKIMEDGFVDGSGSRYNPSMIRIGVGKSAAVRPVALEDKVDSIVSEHMDASMLDANISRYRIDYQRVVNEMAGLRRRVHAITNATPWPLSKNWEIRIDEESFDQTGRVYFVNHKEKATTFEVPAPPEPGETHFPPTAMPEYRSYMSRIVKLVENAFAIKSALERCTIVKSALDSGANNNSVRQALESHVLNSVHLTMTTLGTSGGRVLETADKFEVVVIDEAAQSVEPASLSALQLGSRHCVLVGDPQQLPATIFNVSGRNSKYDRSLFQRLEEAGQPVHMLNQQYRMHPKISHFPRHIFYGGNLKDGPNVVTSDYGNPMRELLSKHLPLFQPFTVLNLDSKEERGGTSLSNSAEADLAVYLYDALAQITGGLIRQKRVAVITPYSQQTKMLERYFSEALGSSYTNFVEINTVDAYQGRESNVVIFSAVRASEKKGSIGFLSDVRRMNVALTRAKHFLFVIARCSSITVNPYWRDLVNHAYDSSAVLQIPIRPNYDRNNRKRKGLQHYIFGNLADWRLAELDGQKPRKNWGKKNNGSNSKKRQLPPPPHGAPQHAPPQHAPLQHAPPQHAPPQHAPPRHSSPLNAQPQHAPAQHLPVQHAPPQHAPPQHAPHSFTPHQPPSHQLPPQQLPPQHLTSQQHAPQQFAPHQFPPQQLASHQHVPQHFAPQLAPPLPPPPPPPPPLPPHPPMTAATSLAQGVQRPFDPRKKSRRF